MQLLKTRDPKAKIAKPKIYKQKLSNGSTRTTNSKTGLQRTYKPKKLNAMSSTAIIEYQTSGGAWRKVCDCSNRPQILKQTMDAIFRSNPGYMKLRAVDSVSKQILDLSFRT